MCALLVRSLSNCPYSLNSWIVSGKIVSDPTYPVIFCNIIATDLQLIIIGLSSAVSLTEDISWNFVPDMYNVYSSIVSSASARTTHRTQCVSVTKTHHDSRSQTHTSRHINCLLLSSGFEYNWNVWTYVSTITSKHMSVQSPLNICR
jgi:hypothetical protein